MAGAGNAIIGALRAVLGIDTAQFETGLKAAQSQLSGFGAGVAKAGAAAAVAFAAAGTAVAVAVKGAINEAEKLNKVSQKIGVPVEELSALKHAAELSETSFESLEKGFVKLSKTMLDAVAKPTGEAADSFRALGISSQFLAENMNQPGKVMLDLADKFEGLNQGAGKTGIALKIFGKSGADLIPLLNAGKAGITEMMQEAKRFGVVIDTDTAKAADNFNDNLQRMHKISQGMILQFTAGLLPALEKVSESFVRMGNTGDGFRGWGETVGSIITALVNVAERLRLEFSQLGSAFTAFWNVVKVAATGLENPKKAWADFQGVLAGNERQMQALIAKQSDATVAIGTTGGAAGEAAKKQTDLNTSVLAGKTALQGIVDGGLKQAASLKAQAEGFGLTAAATDRLRFVTVAYQQAIATGLPIGEAWRAQITAIGNDIEQNKLKLEAQNLILASLPPHEAFRAELEKNRLALLAQGATAEQVAAVQEMTAQKYGNTWGQVGESVAGSFQQIGQTFAKESKTMALVAKGAGVAQALISMWVGAAKALELPFPANLAQWAKVLALGATAVAGIKGVNTGGFATGGAIRVPGGMGGGDRVRAMVDLEPGEQLDVWRPDHGGGDPRRGGGSGTVVQVHVPQPGRDFIGAMIEGINSAVKDGYRIELAPA